MNSKSLTEILQDLVDHARSFTGSDVDLKVYLPKSVLGEYSRTFLPQERIILHDDPDNSTMTLARVRLNGGTVELTS